jgi:hypothetical protein
LFIRNCRKFRVDDWDNLLLDLYVKPQLTVKGRVTIPLLATTAELEAEERIGFAQAAEEVVIEVVIAAVR